MPSDSGTVLLDEQGRVLLDEEGRVIVSDGTSDCDCCGEETCDPCNTCLNDLEGDDGQLACVWVFTVSGLTTCAGTKLGLGLTGRYIIITSAPDPNGTFSTNSVVDGCTRMYTVAAGVNATLYESDGTVVGSGSIDFSYTLQIVDAGGGPPVNIVGFLAVGGAIAGQDISVTDGPWASDSIDTCVGTFDLTRTIDPGACYDLGVNPTYPLGTLSNGGAITVTITHA